jgi:hypothetical protein
VWSSCGVVAFELGFRAKSGQIGPCAKSSNICIYVNGGDTFK